MKRSFWFSLGFAAGLTVARKASGASRRFTPAGVAENVADAVGELATAIGSFGADVRAGMMEREAELHAAVAARTGIDTTPHQAIAAAETVHVPPRTTAAAPAPAAPLRSAAQGQARRTGGGTART